MELHGCRSEVRSGRRPFFHSVAQQFVLWRDCSPTDAARPWVAKAPRQVEPLSPLCISTSAAAGCHLPDATRVSSAHTRMPARSIQSPVEKLCYFVVDYDSASQSAVIKTTNYSVDLLSRQRTCLIIHCLYCKELWHYTACNVKYKINLLWCKCNVKQHKCNAM